jgi:hypothetical protein
MEKYMQFGNFDNLHRRQPPETPRHSPDLARSFLQRIFQWGVKLLRSPLTVVLLVWGILFLILIFALARAQEPGHDVDRRRTATGPARAVCGNKTEAVEIFSAGEDLVIRPQAPEAKAPSRRHKNAVRRRARRR